MVSPVAQMVIDLIVDDKLDVADITAIDLACTNKLIPARQAEERQDLRNTSVYSGPGPDIYGSKDASNQPVMKGQGYRLNQMISPKYLRGITGIAIGRAPRTRRLNMIELEVDEMWRPRCKRFLDPSGRYINVPGIVLQKKGF